ncbi:hypothetical protein D3C81_687750 [compost metagenome]
MHRRHAAQCSEAHVQRLAGARVGGGQQLGGLVVGVFDHADTVDPIQLACLARDVRGGEAQAQVAGVAWVGHFGQHLTITFAIEAVRLDPAEPGNALELFHRLLQQLLKAGSQVQAADKAAHQRVVVALFRKVRRHAHGLELDDQHLVVTVGEHPQPVTAGGAMAQVHVADMKRKALVVRQARKVRAHVEGVADQAGKWAAQQFFGWQAQPVLGVFAGLEDMQVRFIQHQQKPVGLNAARHLDRLLGTAL